MTKGKTPQRLVFYTETWVQWGIGIIGVALLTFLLWGTGVTYQWLNENISPLLGIVAVSFTAAIIFSLFLFIEYKINKTRALKSEFLTVAAHRLRTPLTRVQWSLSSLENEVQSEDGRRTLENTKETVTEFVDIVNQLLDATEAGKQSLYNSYVFEQGNLGTITRKVVTDYAPGILNKNLKISAQIEEELPDVAMDKDRLAMAIGVLLENAIVYTPEGGSITIDIHRSDDEQVKFIITDTGIGIPKESLSFLFTKFFRTKRAISTDPDRIGLGLAIAKEIIERHNGKIDGGSIGSDQGSTFWFTLPIPKELR